MRIISGGQTGVDRAALDAAVELGLPYGGWCPRGGWAEDYPVPPGVRALYPLLQETPKREPAQRTRRNVRDSDRTIILTDSRGMTNSRGSALTLNIAERLGKPFLAVDIDATDAADRIAAWLDGAGPHARLNVAGPRESTAPGIYDKARAVLEQVLADRGR